MLVSAVAMGAVTAGFPTALEFPGRETLAIGGISDVARVPLSLTGGGTLIIAGEGAGWGISSSPSRFASMACNADLGGPAETME